MPSLDTARRAWMCRAAMATAAWLANPECAFAESAPLDELAHKLLKKRRNSVLHDYLSEWPGSSERRSSIASPLPVLKFLPTLRAKAPLFSAALVDALTAMAATLAWRRSYSSPDVSTQFLENYGWTEFIGLTGPVPSERLACGVLLLGPDTTYPAHHHEAEEVYVPLSGNSAWKQGSGGWRQQMPGAVIHHLSETSHSMRTSGSPLLALYMWRSENLAQKSQLD